MTRIELLAPAKNLECGMAAIDCGADAVYIGAPRFGAREDAGNPIQDIEALVQYAHRYWARVYVTLNTLLRDSELPQAERLVEALHEIHVDGVIIQDTGLLECELPPIPLIASTQMHNHTPERVAFLEQIGFQRAILARELSLEEIRAIRAKSSQIELECFIHGALCVCYSGQCYLSYALGGRSGNRGECAQPCRKCYSLVDGNGATVARDRYMLSLRDLNLTDHLGDLLDAGVTSFKIEGRLKEKSYIMNVVSHYRAQLDAAMAARGLRKSSSGASAADFTPDPIKTFNRGFTTHHLLGRGAKVVSPFTPKMVGEPVGTVTAVTRRGVTLDGDAVLHNGDGICFYDAQRQLRGTQVNGVQGQQLTLLNAEELAVGTAIYRNHDHEFLTRLAKIAPERRIAVSFTLRDTRTGFTLSAEDEDGNTATFALDAEKARAEKPEAAEGNIRKQLAKTGGTIFSCSAVTVELPIAYFLPVATLNALRRGVLERLEAVRAENHPRRTGRINRNIEPYPERTLAYEGNVLNEKASLFYRRHGVRITAPAAESGFDMKGKRVMTTKYCLKYTLGYCRKAGGTKTCAEPLALLDGEGHRLPLRFDCARCVMEVWMEK